MYIRNAFKSLKVVKYSLFISVFCCSISFAQEVQVAKDPNPRLKQMNELQSVIDSKLRLREKLRASVKTAAVDELVSLESELDKINNQILSNRKSFEQLAVGSTAGTDLFAEQSATFDWRQEVALIMLPFIENLKLLTEKPRKTQNLKSLINLNQQRSQAAEEAIASIKRSIDAATEESTRLSLNTLLTDWQERLDESQLNINLASVQLNNLQDNDLPWWKSFGNAVTDFIKGRGLTLLLAILGAGLVWLALKLLTSVFTKRTKGEDVKTYRTRQRFILYAVKTLTFALMLVVVITVFYIRGDILLMGMSFFIAAGILLGLRNIIPKFISELRLLLNIGSIREGERVMYNGLPWRVVSLNVDTILKNPEITGVIRLPLQSIEGLASRPAGSEPWFPASKGDFIFFTSNRIMQVTAITPEHVAMRSLGGTTMSVPSSDFYNTQFENLTQGETFTVSGTFGVGYSHQSAGVVEIPNTLKDSVTRALEGTELANSVDCVAVELEEAGASSLNYWVGVTMKSDAAKSYNKIARLIQQVCVETCTQKNWDIPFPQLTLHQS